ncbi:ParB/RepB/Spo0J family partition protein [Sphingomonas koreensis]|uniref:ParB/RepB/Spo0J family partition protein n=1 Tax=Sphingomonas koreensis TaxID=93064 RepID=A0A430FZ11_9SPHN|nr:ParB/RepB/Spo0J family partition protein [Sphingomonas koreensis]RSY78061.1 ParB/RepB/Spo0J family partition protein [Sphingomonas koreensis]
MELKHIDIAKLCVSPVNMRGVKKAPDLTNILPSVRARGVLVPLIVRQNGSPDNYEIVAGKRRYHAALAVAAEGGGIEELPCAVIEAGDDAAALEASLIENIARLDPDEVTRWETFTRLIREGRSPEDIALTFGLTEVQVKRTLALGNLLPRIRSLYRSEAIDAVTVRHLTLASKAQQRDWLTLVDAPDSHAPTGHQLKSWLFGGASISTKVALFGLAGFTGEIVADLFGDDSYFASVDAFWTAQEAAIEERAEAYREAGWAEVIIMERGAYFHSWEHERRTKRQGGKVYVAIDHRGGVAFHEGYISTKEAKKLVKGEAIKNPVRPEVTSSLQDYIDLHRHAAVRAKLADAPDIALRVAVAHMIAGSLLWSVRVEPQRAASDAVTESVEMSSSEAVFDEKRRAIIALLAFDPETPTVTGGDPDGVTALLAGLLRLDDAQVLSALAIVMGETLDARSNVVDALGQHLAVDMAQVWQADDALLDAIRDREVLTAMVEEVAGKQVAEANAKESGKVLRSILKDCLTGANGRAKVEGWVPRWMRFPASGYTTRGGVGSVRRSATVAALLAPEPAEPEINPEPMREAA